MSNPLQGAKQMANITLGDTRWPARDGWIKMENIIKFNGKTISVILHCSTCSLKQTALKSCLALIGLFTVLTPPTHS